MKLVGLLTARNEQWVLGLTARAALSAMDELIAVDHASDDATPEILAQVAAEHPGRVHLLREEDPSWREAAIRQRLLDEARGRGATHVCALDADEVIAGTLLPGLRDAFAALAPGEGLRVPWIDLWRNLDEFRDDSSFFSRSRGILGFRDHPGLGYRPSDQGIDIHVRRPKGLLGEQRFPASHEEGGILHLAYVHWSRIRTRMVWYKMIEILRFRDHRTPELVNERYDGSMDETGLRTSPVPPAWWAPYAALRNQVDLSAASWFEQECRRLWNEHGARAFQGVDLWGIVNPEEDLGGAHAGNVESGQMDRSRVCVLFPHHILGGGETAMMAVAEGLRSHFEVSVAALDRRRMTVERSARGELVDRFGAAAFVREPDELRAALAPAEAVLWYGMNPFTPQVLESMPRRPASVRVVHTGKDEEGPLYHERWKHCIDAVVCVSPAMQRRIPGAVFIPNTASLDRLQGAAHAFFPPGRKTLGYLGRLFVFKNVLWLIDHLEELDCNLLIQGIDSEELTRADLEERARARGVAGRVRFLEPAREVGTLLRSVDALVLVSQQEGFPVVAVEAGLLAVPVIATRVGALPEVFPEEIAFVDLDGDAPCLTSLRAALRTAGPELGRSLKERVLQVCDPETVVARYAALLREQIAARR